MSVRGPRGGRGRGQGRGRGSGRGRGRGKTVVWEWENYTPGPEVYDQLWHIRKEPATVTPFPPTECPIPHAQTRITDRRQTEGDIQRNFYVVEVTYSQPRDSSLSSGENGGPDRTEILHVDLSRIMEYVSPDELERYENEQFKIEAEADAIALRAEAEEAAQRRLEKNAKSLGAGKGSCMLNGLGLNTKVQARGRPRGRGRGRGRGGWRGRGVLVLSGKLRDEDLEEQLVHVEYDDVLQREQEDMQIMITETDSEEEEMLAARDQTLPGLTRSAFVTNSALPVFPVTSNRRLTGIPIIQRARQGDADDSDDSDLESVDADAQSTSSTAMQLRIEDDFRGRSDFVSDDESSGGNRRSSKRRRTESTVSKQRIPLPMPKAGRTYPQSTPESSSIGDSTPGESVSSQLSSGLQFNGADTAQVNPWLLVDPLVKQYIEEDSDDSEEDAEE